MLRLVPLPSTVESSSFKSLSVSRSLYLSLYGNVYRTLSWMVDPKCLGKPVPVGSFDADLRTGLLPALKSETPMLELFQRC